MTRTVVVDGRRFAVSPGVLLGQGGEAEVYDLGDGRVVKWWKPPEHPDFAGDAAAQEAARARIATAPARLGALPKGLPATTNSTPAIATWLTALFRSMASTSAPRVPGACKSCGRTWCRTIEARETASTHWLRLKVSFT